MNKKAIQDRLRAIQNDMATLESIDKPTDEQREKYKALIVEGTGLRKDLDVILEGEALKGWMNGPDGKSAFKQFGGPEVTSPADRDQEKRAEEAAARLPYKSAFEAYMRYGPRALGPNDFKLLREGTIKATGEFKALGETNDALGGYLAPEEFVAEVLKKEPGPLGLVDIVRHQPTSRDVIVWPVIRYTTDNAYTAPHRLTFTGEVPATAGAHTVTDQTFGQARIPVNLAMASQKLSNSLIEDSAVDVMGLTAQLFRENIMQDVEYYIAQGTGAGQPEGITVNATAQTNKIVSGSAATLTSNGLKDMYWGVPAQYRKNFKWVMSSATAQVISKLTDANGRYIWQETDQFGGGLGAAQSDGQIISQPKLLGAPVAISEQMPSVTTNSYPISAGDHRGYIQAERVGMTVRVLDELYAETDQKLFLLRYRFGGGLAEDYRIRLQKVSQ